MKKTIYSITIAGLMLTTIALTSCQTSTEKKQVAKATAENTNEQLPDANQDSNAEYTLFKRDEEEQIGINETRIAEIRARISDSGKAPLDGLRKKRIDDLETRNAELRSRLYGYEPESTDWVTFKAGFNRDMDKLRDAFADFGNDLKN